MPCRTLQALHIKKKRNPRGVPSYEVVWTDTEGQYDGLIPDDQFEDGEDPLTAWTTTERQDLMLKYYPKVVEAYEESIKKPPKEKKTRARKKKDNDNINTDKPKRKYTKKPKIVAPVDSINASMKTGTNTSALNVSVNVNRLKRKIKNNTKKGQKTLTSFIASKKRRASKQVMQSLRKSFKNISLNCEDNIMVADDNYQFEGRHIDTNKENKPSPHYLSMLNKTDDEIEDIDLSDIIDNIISRPPEIKTAKVDNKLVRLVFEKYSTPKKMSLRKSVLTQIHNNCSTPRDSPVRKSNFRFSTHSNDNSIIGKVNTSYFFDKLTEDGDAFEMSLEQKDAVVLLDSTLEYSLPDVRL